MTRLIDKSTTWLIIILTGLIPFFFLPFTSEFYEFNKNILLFFSVLLSLLLWIVKIIITKEVKFRRTVFDLPVLALAGAFILSTLLNAPNKLETLWLPNGTGTIIALTILYFIITNNIKKTTQGKIIGAFLTGGVILSLISIYQFIGLGEAFINDNSLFVFLKVKSWTPSGGLFPLITFLAVSLTLSLTQIYASWKEKKQELSFYLHLFIALIFISGIILSLYQLLTTVKPLLLPFSTAWAIAVESFKNWRIFLLGVGPNSFLDAFSQFRPASYNLTPLWTTRFVDSQNLYLHLLSTVGILGLAAFLWLVIKTLKNRPFSFIHYPLLVIFIIFLFLPSNFLMLFALYLLLALLANNSPSHEYRDESRILPWAIFIPTLLIIIGCFFLIGRIYAAEIYFQRSLKSIAQNDGTSAYNYQSKAIRLNSHYDFYRLSYAQTNLLLADTLASKTNISDQDRQNITVLIQQAISEAKTAVSLNENKITNWENLANLYRQLINFAQGADQWVVATLRQAINLEPTNPQLKLNLGGTYYALGNYDEAILWFQKVIDDKVDFANAYYNLSWAYKEKGDLKKAHEMMQVVLNFLATDSSDYQKARDELEELAKELPMPSTETTSRGKEAEESIPEQPLIEPQPLPSPIIEPPIELPQEATSSQ